MCRSWWWAGGLRRRPAAAPGPWQLCCVSNLQSQRSSDNAASSETCAHPRSYSFLQTKKVIVVAGMNTVSLSRRCGGRSMRSVSPAYWRQVGTRRDKCLNKAQLLQGSQWESNPGLHFTTSCTSQVTWNSLLQYHQPCSLYWVGSYESHFKARVQILGSCWLLQVGYVHLWQQNWMNKNK